MALAAPRAQLQGCLRESHLKYGCVWKNIISFLVASAKLSLSVTSCWPRHLTIM